DYLPFLQILRILKNGDPILGEWKLFSEISAVFTQMVDGYVLSPEFKTAFPNAGFTNITGKLFNIAIRRKMTKLEEAQISLIRTLEELGGIAQDFFRSKYFKLGILFVSILAILYAMLIAVSAVLSNPFVNRYLDSFGRLLSNPAESSLAQGETSELSDSPSLALEENPNNSESIPTSFPTPATEELRVYNISGEPDLLELPLDDPRIVSYGQQNLRIMRQLIQTINNAIESNDVTWDTIENQLLEELQNSRPASLDLIGDQNLLKEDITDQQLMINSRARLIEALRAYEINNRNQFSQTRGVIYNLDSPLAIQLKCATAKRLPLNTPDVIGRLGCQGDEQ
ncbi:MAG: hypothetical protein HC924_13530, partial [Synechococcaceae cyanobacterium SM2_3_2]|nr:hypothetical protein [Synechococcaceae cyanobacterium SM2_3_2]